MKIYSVPLALKMKKLLLFTDGSVDVQTKTGYGACLVVREPEELTENLKNQVCVKRFEQTTSTKLELQTLLWALNEIQPEKAKILIFTDSQNIMGLHGRRGRFEANNYFSKNNRQISNHELYREFFRITDQLDCEFIKVQGHQPSRKKDKIHQLFTLVDRASRNALRNNNA